MRGPMHIGNGFHRKNEISACFSRLWFPRETARMMKRSRDIMKKRNTECLLGKYGKPLILRDFFVKIWKNQGIFMKLY